jgi:hypothetical protein
LTWFEQPQVQAAIVTLVASIIVAIITAKLTLKNDERIKHLENTLAKQQFEDKSRLDYEYEAKKRLYQEYEPLLFQLNELSESALTRIINISRDGSNGFLTSDNGWFSEKKSYYLLSTVYRILAPMVVYKLMRRRLTLFDLKLNFYFNTQYTLAKILYRTFSKDFKVASILPKIGYYPYGDYKIPNQSRRQGIVIGMIDNLTEALIEYDENDKIYRIMSYGNFEKRLFEGGEFYRLFEEIFTIFVDFHPKEEPVLWRILIVQALIHKLLLTNIPERELKIEESYFYEILHVEEKKFDWRTEDAKKTNLKTNTEADFKAAANYVFENLTDTNT